MRALIVGAGSVGQVYGHHLQRGGAEVHVYVRRKYARQARQGYPIYPPGGSGSSTFTPDGICHTAGDVAETSWDQIWLCVSSPAIRGDWLAPVIEAAGEATLVSLQPNLRDRDLLLPLVGEERLVIGLIAFAAWHAPLPGSATREPGQAWWFPAMSPSIFEGAAAKGVVAGLRAGGCPAKVGSATLNAARGSALLIAVVATMECAGWTFAGLREERWTRLAAGAGRQALATATTHLGVDPGLMGLLLRPTVIRAISRVAPVAAPMDVERFLEVHFSKVGDQTMLGLDEWIAAGERQDLPVDQLVALRTALREARGQQPS